MEVYFEDSIICSKIDTISEFEFEDVIRLKKLCSENCVQIIFITQRPVIDEDGDIYNPMLNMPKIMN